MNNKIFKCPFCDKEYTTREALYDHVTKIHPDQIPEGLTVKHYLFNLRNKKDHSICVVCKIHNTEWNEDAERYNRFCSDRCTQIYVNQAKQRMMEKYGKEHLLNDPEHQQMMSDSRSISGIYKFNTDGTEVPYMGTYEYHFLKYLDTELSMNGKEILRCPHYFPYMYNGKSLMFIPDYFLPDYNLIVEIKDGGDNPNMHPKIQSVDKVKEQAKDLVMKQQRDFNYIKVTNKQYNTLLYIITLIRDSSYEDPDFKDKKVNYTIFT